MLKDKLIPNIATGAWFLGLFLLADFLLPRLPDRPEERMKWDRLGILGGLGHGRREILQIYSVVKRNRAELSEDDVWGMAETIFNESNTYAMDPMLVLAVIQVESGFQQELVSVAGARGLMQILPPVAHALAAQLGLAPEDKRTSPKFLDDPVLNIKIGVFYLSQLRKQFSDLKLALMAYNWGPTEIVRRLEENESMPFEYATKVLSTYRSYQGKSQQT
jgi:soluble lytic murein transglycosylase